MKPKQIIIQPKDYQISDEDISSIGSIPSYFGYTNSIGAWVIIEVIKDDGTYKYSRGDGNYSSKWDDRTSLTYDELKNKYFDKDILLALIKSSTDKIIECDTSNVTIVESTLPSGAATENNQLLQLNRTITSYATPSSYSIVVGTLDSGTLENAKHEDRTYMVIGETDSGLEILFDFTLPTDQNIRRINFCGQYIGGDGHKIDVYIYNHDTTSWDEISTTNFKDILPTESDVNIVWDMDNDDYVDSAGSVRIKFKHAGGGEVGHALKIDCISCGDYKSPQLLADIGDKLDDIKVLTDRGYIELQAQGTKVQYDLLDPRVKLANTNDIRCIGDLTDDADFKGINIPIVEKFNEFPATQVSQRLRIFSSVPSKNLFLPQIWSDITYALTYGKNRSFSEMDDKRILETIIIFPTTVTDTLRIAWRIVPENATQKDFANTPFTIQELSQQGMTFATNRIAIVNGETNIQFMKTVYSDGRLWIGIEWLETAVRYNGLYTIAFNKDQGFSFIADIVTKSSNAYMKGISLTKSKGGDVFFIKQSITAFTIYKNDGSTAMNYLFGNTYPGFSAIEGTGILSTPYLGDDTDDTLLIAFAFDTSTMVVYKVPWVQGSNINPPLADVTINGIYMSSSVYRVVDMFSLDTGEVQISYYDDDEGDQSELSNTSFGDTGSYTLYYDTHTKYNFISTDKHYMINSSSTQGSFSTYYITPIDLSIFAEAIISYDDLNITFSNALVSGSKFYIMKYISENRIVKNEITYDVNGQAIRKPFLTKDTIYNASDVQINPSTEEKQDDNIVLLTTINASTEQLSFHDGHLKLIDYYDAIGHNVTTGDITKKRANGKKTGIGADIFTIIENHPFIQPLVDVQMYVQSTDAQDGIGGTGIQEITIEYFDFAWVKHTQVIVMNGITQVTIPNIDKYRINTIFANKVGTYQRAEGDITITELGGTILYGQIDQYSSIMERCIFYVATGEQVTCTEIAIGSTSNAGVEIRLVASEEDASGNIVPRMRIPFEIIAGGKYIDFKIGESVANPTGKRMAILLVIRSAGTATNQRGTGAMKGINEVI